LATFSVVYYTVAATEPESQAFLSGTCNTAGKTAANILCAGSARTDESGDHFSGASAGACELDCDAGETAVLTMFTNDPTPTDVYFTAGTQICISLYQ
jgi:hypothetical protein